MNWKIKAAAQGLLSVVPGGRWVNDRLQRALGDLRHLHVTFDGKFEDWRLPMTYLQDNGIWKPGLRLLEVGTGWYPALPLAFSLAGAESVRTYDINRHLNPRLTFLFTVHLEKHLEIIARASGRPPAEVEHDYARLRDAKTLEALLAAARVIYAAPVDASATGLPEASIDLAYSVSVLEHVPSHDIARILRESARIVAPGGAILHSIACCDHYALFDRSITELNYLQYDERAWRKWNNALQYQNRLRAPDFLGMVAASGFRTVSEYPHREPRTLARLDELKLAPEFHKYSREEWSITSLGLVALREQS
jgi:SAM-dependent methyltransferase